MAGFGRPMAVLKSGAEKAGVVAIVPTTAGAIEIVGLRWSQKIPSSRVVLGNETADQCERWTREYNSLLRPGDPMRTLLGLQEGGGYRLVVSAEIDHGRSWMMPVSAGHFAAARGEALHNDIARARLLIWSTGAIDFSQPETAADARVVENDYHLLGKIDHSRALFAAAAHAGAPVLCVLPRGPDAEKAAAVLAKVLGGQAHHVAIAASLADCIAPLDGFLRSNDFRALPENDRPLAVYVAPASRSDKSAAADPAEAVEPPPVPLPPTPSAPPPPSVAPKTTERRLPLGALMAAGVAALAIGGAYVALTGGGRLGAAATKQAPPPVPDAPQQQRVASVPQPPAPAALASPRVAPPQIAPTRLSAPIGKLTLLTAPPGSSCQAQIYLMQPRFAETVVDVPGDQAMLEIDGANLCGLAIVGANFQRGSGSATVASLSSANRIVFAPNGQPIAPPALGVAGGAIGRVELKLK